MRVLTISLLYLYTHNVLYVYFTYVTYACRSLKQSAKPNIIKRETPTASLPDFSELNRIADSRQFRRNPWICVSVTCTREYIPLRFRSAGFSADLSRDVLSQRSRPTSGATAHKTRLRHTYPSLSRSRKKHPRAKRFFSKVNTSCYRYRETHPWKYSLLVQIAKLCTKFQPSHYRSFR